jgi:hypothetical protein
MARYKVTFTVVDDDGDFEGIKGVSPENAIINDLEECIMNVGCMSIEDIKVVEE